MPRKEQAKYVLIPELIPSDLWGRSAYRMLGSGRVWKQHIRPDAINKAQGRCELCGTKEKRLICHDKWRYDDKSGVATLIDFEIHCGNCDSVTHLGRAMQIGDPDEALMLAVRQITTINKCEPHVAIEIIKKACIAWDKRNKKKWTIKVAAELLMQYPELIHLSAFIPEKSDK